MSSFDTHGGFFSPQDYMKVEAGGTHEENPNGGVQVGVDPQGVPNLLEEGEPVYKDYVYSDNIKASERFLKENTIPEKYAGELYSTIADKLFEEAENRPFDPISRNGLEAMLGRLADAQESQKAYNEQRALERELKKLSPDELAALDQMLIQAEQPAPAEVAPVMPEQIAPQPVAPEQIAPEQLPVEQPVMKDGGKMNTFPTGGYTRRLRNGAIARGGQPFHDGRYDFFGNYTLFNPNQIGYMVPMPIGVGNNTGGLQFYDQPNPKLTFYSPEGYAGIVSGGLVDYPPKPSTTITSTGNGLPYPADERISALPQTTDSPVNTESNPYLSTLPRYAGALGAAGLGLYNAFQTPDRYTATRYRPFTPTGRISLQNQVYNPVDQNMLMNQVLAQGNSTQRALRNSGLGPSSAAAILAADNNTTGNIGNTFLQAWDANNQRRNQVIAANNQNEAQRAQFDFGVDSARQRALAEAQYRNAQNDLMLQRLNYAAEGDKYAAVGNQISNALQAISGIGRENFAMNQVNSNTANEGYGVLGGGIGAYLPYYYRSCGGNIQRKKR